MTSDGQVAKTKMVDLKKLWNFIVNNLYNFYVWIS